MSILGYYDYNWNAIKLFLSTDYPSEEPGIPSLSDLYPELISWPAISMAMMCELLDSW